jgi:hypothetical protein
MSVLDHLRKSLDFRANELSKEWRRTIESIMRSNAAQGRLASGATVIGFQEEAKKAFDACLANAAKFAFNLTGSKDEEVIQILDRFSEQVRTSIVLGMLDGAKRLNFLDQVADAMLQDGTSYLRYKQKQFLEDYRYGMVGSDKLKKDPVVSIVSNQTNSPGAVQQVGVGDFSQKALVQNYQPLVDAINKALASPEFAKLEPRQRDGFEDVADTLLDEARKKTPHPGKLKRWGTRLGELALQLGMKVAGDEIIHVIGKIFGV